MRLVTIVLLCTAALLAPPAASTQPSVKNGQIAFMRPGKVGEYDIWVVQPSGKGLRRLTASPENQSDYNPDWAPDGSSVLFERRNEGGDDLYVIGASGSGLRRLTDCAIDCWSDSEARWSPDAQSIAFGRATGPRDQPGPTNIAIYVMSADGTNIRELTRPPAGFEDHYPTWAPDGRTIVFQRDTSTSTPGRTTLIAVDVARGTERIVYRLPDWAPGSGIASYSMRLTGNASSSATGSQCAEPGLQRCVREPKPRKLRPSGGIRPR